jgi:hypothetical protein
MRKEFNNKKGSIGFGAENFFTPVFKIRSETISPVINQKGLNEMRNMSFRINVSYRIGKMSFDGPRRKKSVNNDDLKDGGGDGGGMGDAQQGGQGNNGGQRQGNARMPVVNTTAPKLPAADPAVKVVAEGSWTYTIESPQGGGGKLVIKKEGEAYSGTVTSTRNNKETPFTSIAVKGNEITITYDSNFGGNTVAIQVRGIITGDVLAGTMSIGQFATFPLNGKRDQ